jgi:hypothetical protein
VKLALVILALVLALLGWYKPDTVPVWLTGVATAILVVVAILQIALLRKEKKEKEKSRYTGELRTEQDDVLLSSKDSKYPKLELGDSGAVFLFAGETGTPLFRFFENSHLTVVKDGGQLKVSTNIYDKRGNLVAELRNNEWRVNQNASFDRNFSNCALEVKDASGDIILQVRLVEDRIQIQAKFYGPNGEGVALGKGFDAQGNPGGIMEITGPRHPVLQMQIPPLFKYPSDLHMGEYAAP